jgi:hypothetical protein
LFDQFRQLKRDGEGKVTKIGTRRHFGCELLDIDAEQIEGGGAEAVFKFLL